MQQHHVKGVLSPLIGGIAALAVAMGIGRFAYTPLLPLMQGEFSFGADVGGLLASLNFVGYLLGALFCSLVPLVGWRTLVLRGSLGVSIVTTALMGLTTIPMLWGGIRLLSGVASAGVMILGTALVLEALTHHTIAWLRGLIYSGIGAGIMLTSVLVLLWEDTLITSGIWLGLAAVSLPLVIIAWKLFPPDVPPVPLRRRDAPTPTLNTRSIIGWLVFSYFCEGLGYIVTGTFLVAIVRATDVGRVGGTLVWMVVGLAAIVGTPLWTFLGARYGMIRTLVAAHILQAIGIVLPALSGSLWSAFLSAALFGGTFLGIAMLSLSIGRSLAPERATSVIGILTASFGIGQAIGPTLAGVVAVQLGSFTLPLLGAAGVVALGGGALGVAAMVKR